VDFLPSSVIQSTLDEIAAQLATGTITPLRNITHTMGSVASALRQMTQASHVGKVVAAVQKYNSASSLAARPYPSLTITGGSGGLGVLISTWIAQRIGPTFITLLGRSSKVSDKTALALLLSTTTCITSCMADAGMAADAEVALGFGTAEGPAPSAIMHASGILQDAMLDKQTSSSFKQVFAPKLGCLAALEASGCLPLSTLTVFSSVASLLGGAGQGNYAAANAVLDSWSHASQASGSVARSVQWGAWASSGMASEAVLRRLTRIGQGMITPEQGLLSLMAVLGGVSATGASAIPQLTVNDFIWGTYLKDACPLFFSEFELEHGKFPF